MAHAHIALSICLGDITVGTVDVPFSILGGKPDDNGVVPLQPDIGDLTSRLVLGIAAFKQAVNA